MADEIAVTLSAMRAGIGPLDDAARITETFGRDLGAAASAAAGSAGAGPLQAVLDGYSDEMKSFATKRARAVTELSQALSDSADQYASDDGSAADRLRDVDFG